MKNLTHSYNQIYGLQLLILFWSISTCKGYDVFFPLSELKLTIPKTDKSINLLDGIPIAQITVKNLDNHTLQYFYKIEYDRNGFLQIDKSTGELFIGDNFHNLDNPTTFIISAYNTENKNHDAHMSIEITPITPLTSLSSSTTTDNTLNWFCTQFDKLCFWDSASYTIDEDKKLLQFIPKKIGDLNSQSMKKLCPQYDVSYQLKSPSNEYIIINGNTLYANELLDHDSLYPGYNLTLDIECVIKSKWDYSNNPIIKILGKTIKISIIDRNDNGPKLQENTKTTWTFDLNDPHFSKDDEIGQNIIFVDQDSLAMNAHLTYKIHNDIFKILKPACNAYEADHMGLKNSVISCKLKFARDGILSKSPYCIILEAFDPTIDSDDRKSAATNICIRTDLEKIHEADKPRALALQSGPSNIKRGRKQSRRIQSSEADLSIYSSQSAGSKFSFKSNTIEYPKDVYVYRTAANLSRVTQPVQMIELINRPSIKFNITDDPTKAFGITELGGIIYVRNVTALKNAPETIYYLTVSWPNNKKYVIIHLQKGRPNNASCEELDEALPTFSCSQVGTKKECNQICGAGTDGGVCQWRGSNTTGLTIYYSTCSPNLTYCPDNTCDPLEEIGEKADTFICPQDCSLQTFGSLTTNPNKRGIFASTGICTCDPYGKCSCAAHDTFPAKLKKSLKNKSGNDKKSINNNSTATVTPRPYLASSVETITSFQCGTSCILLMIGCPSVLIIIVIGLIISRRKYVKRAKQKILNEKIENDEDHRNDHDLPLVPLDAGFKFEMNIDSKWEFPCEQLTLDVVLGEGEFGKVVKGYALNIDGDPGVTTVAVKMLKPNASPVERQALISEFQLLQEVSHPNVIKLLGACSLGDSPMIIIEYALYGSLRSYLRLSRKIECSGIEFTNGVEQVTAKDILSFAWQICKGMAYLTEIKLVHRDLAARNVLLAERKICKISDFGLTRDVYEDDAYLKRSRDRVPVKWMAPESLADHVYTTKSDVWAFGVLAWELITLGASPYPGVPPENLYHLLKTGYRMERPENCSEEIYSIIQQCWASDPSSRPSFKYLASQWEKLLGNNAKYLELEEMNAVSNPTYCQDTTKQQSESMNPPLSSTTNLSNNISTEQLENLDHLWKSPEISNDNNIDESNCQDPLNNQSSDNNDDIREKFKIPPGYDLPRALIETKTIEQTLRYQNDVRFPLNIKVSPSKCINIRQSQPSTILDPNHYSVPVKRGRSYMDMTNKNLISDNLDNEDIEKRLSKNISFRFSSLLNINEHATSVV